MFVTASITIIFHFMNIIDALKKILVYTLISFVQYLSFILPCCNLYDEVIIDGLTCLYFLLTLKYVHPDKVFHFVLVLFILFFIFWPAMNYKHLSLIGN